MCGISGIISKNFVEKDFENRIKKIIKSLDHRGPDYNSYLKINNGFLGHNRLKIIDLSEISNQPMVSNSNRYFIVFNGEIYNYKELKAQLNQYNFKTNGDTEVILASIELKGISWFLENCNGMFAIAVYDNLENKIYLLRDRLGIKPLYYYLDNENLIFSSEVKGILNSGLIEPELNTWAIDQYLAFRDSFEPETFFKDIFQVKSGTFIEFNLNSFEKKEFEYWVLPNLENHFNENFDEVSILTNLNLELKKAIDYRIISDVNFGTYLSGGLDSSLITSITADKVDFNLNTYTIGFNEEKFNEFEFSDIVAKQKNTNHHKITLEKSDYLDLCRELIEYKDSPLGVPNEIPLAIMSRELKKKITVVLSGEGADELFAGYGRIFRFPFYFENSDKFKDKNYIDEFLKEYEYVPRSFRKKYLNFNLQNYWKENDIKIKSLINEENPYNFTFKFFHKIHIKSLLKRLDMTTMYASVEGRVPFLDHNLIEYVYKNIPYSLKNKWNNNVDISIIKNKHPKEYSEDKDIPKYILKKLGENYLSNEIIYRKKMGFPVPLQNWFKDLEKLSYQRFQKSLWLNQLKIDDLFEDLNKLPNGGQVLWMLLNIDFFIESYFSKKWRY